MADINLDDLPRIRKEALETGKKHYFTGNPCPNGHIAARFTLSRNCVVCAREKVGRCRASDPEKARQKARDKYAGSLEKSRKYAREWQMKNAVRLRAKKESAPEKYRERSRVNAKAWRDRNPEKSISSTRAWQKSNPDKVRAIDHTRRARKFNADGAHTASDIARIRAAQKDRCAMPDCRTKLGGKGHVDHIIALSKGGSNWPRNLQLLCEPCNLSKSARDPIEFAQSRGMLI
jgi:5-methylcytosine-specific restriction endonuclease McrA